MGVVAAAIIGGIAVAGASYAAGQSAKSAANRAAAAQDAATAGNLLMFEQSRGSEGSSIFPVYGTEAEKAVFRNAQDSFIASQKFLGTPAEQYQWYQNNLAPQRAQFDAGTGLVTDIYSGAVTDRQLANAKPVMAARTAGAAGQKSSLLQAAQETVNRTKAMSPGSFGTFAQKMQLASLAPGLQAASQAEALAELKNAEDVQAIQNMRDTLGLQYLNQPLTSAQQAVAMRVMPTQAVGQAFNASVAPLSMFNIGVGKPPNIPPLPTAGAIPGVGQIAASAVGAGANAYSNYLVNQQFAKQIAAAQNPYGTYRAPAATITSPNYVTPLSTPSNYQGVEDLRFQA